MAKGKSTVAPEPEAKTNPTTAPKKTRPRSTLDQKLENGPLADRGCTDIICCLLYLAILGLCIYITSVGFIKGDPWRLAQPFDLDQNACGAVNSKTSVSSADSRTTSTRISTTR